MARLTLASCAIAVLTANASYGAQLGMRRFCAPTIRDAMTGGACIQASAIPTNGMLFPLGPMLFVAPDGRIGMGTTAPQAALHIASWGGRLLLQDNGDPDPFTSDPFMEFRTSDGTTIGFVGDGSPTGDVMDLTAVTGQARVITGSAAPVILMTNSLPRVLIDGTGNVGVGTTTPSQRLTVAGNICATGSISVCSDAKFKTSVEPIRDARQILDRIDGVRFDWRVDEFPDMGFTSDPQIGFIAQDVREALPEAVALGADGTYSVDYGRLVPVLVEALKELEAENDALERELEDLRGLRDRLDSIERAISEIPDRRKR